MFKQLYNAEKTGLILYKFPLFLDTSLAHKKAHIVVIISH